MSSETTASVTVRWTLETLWIDAHRRALDALTTLDGITGDLAPALSSAWRRPARACRRRLTGKPGRVRGVGGDVAAGAALVRAAAPHASSAQDTWRQRAVLEAWRVATVTADVEGLLTATAAASAEFRTAPSHVREAIAECREALLDAQAADSSGDGASAGDTLWAVAWSTWLAVAAHDPSTTLEQVSQPSHGRASSASLNRSKSAEGTRLVKRRFPSWPHTDCRQCPCRSLHTRQGRGRRTYRD